jgi:pyruvate dehydrogenase E2 component (dihydrolipoamide acetyltransferase)
MATKVHMEALSPTMEEGQIVSWLKSEGDDVSNGEILAEIETDKATMELVARGDGKLRKILLEEGGTAPVGTVIAVIAEEGEDIEGLVSEDEVPRGGEATPAKAAASAGAVEESSAPAETKQEEPAAPPEAAGPAPEESTKEEAPAEPAVLPPEATAAPPEGGGRIKASPLARRLAAEEGLSLASIRGSGPGGRIVKKDVEEAAREGVPAGVAGPAPSEADYQDVPLTQMRKTIAKRLVESLGPVPHFFLTVDIDMARAAAARKRVNALLDKQGVKVSFNDIILKATAMALTKHPNCNAHWGGDYVRQFNRVHMGVAVAIEEGLITPVVRDAHLKGLAQIATEVRELAGRAREKKLKPDEYTGATFTVSNLGMFGIEAFTGVINPPEAGILAVGAVEERPVISDGQVAIGQRMRMTMSCDHRVIDGAQGARFLETLTAILEEPLAALI